MIMHFRVAIEILNKLRSKLGLKQYDITLTKKKKVIIISDTKNNKSIFKWKDIHATWCFRGKIWLVFFIDHRLAKNWLVFY